MPINENMNIFKLYSQAP